MNAFRQTLAIGLLINGYLTAPMLFAQEPIETTTNQTVTLKPFHIEYQIKKNGFTLGTADISLNHETESALWRHTTTATASGLLGLFSSRSATEYALVSLNNNQISPQFYHSAKKSETIETEYDHQTKLATMIIGDTIHRHTLDQDYYDTQSMQAALIADLQLGFEKKTYHLLDEGDIKAYEMSFEGKETITTNSGDYETLKLKQTRGNRETLSWHAPSLNYAPVQIHNYRKGKLSTTMALKKVNLPIILPQAAQ